MHIARYMQVAVDVLKDHNFVVRVPSHGFGQRDKFPTCFAERTFADGHLVFAVIKRNILKLVVREQAVAAIDRVRSQPHRDGDFAKHFVFALRG